MSDEPPSLRANDPQSVAETRFDTWARELWPERCNTREAASKNHFSDSYQAHRGTRSNPIKIIRNQVQRFVKQLWFAVLAVAPSPACERTFFSLNTPEFQSKDAVSSLQRNYRCMSILFLTLWGSLSNVMEKVCRLLLLVLMKPHSIWW